MVWFIARSGVGVGRGFLGVRDDCLFSGVTGGMGTCAGTGPSGRVVELNVNSMAEPLTPTYVRTVRGTISRVTSRGAFHNCPPRCNCSFLLGTVGRGSCHSHNVRLSGSRVFISSNTGDSANGVNSVFSLSGGITVYSPICPMCISAGMVSNHSNRGSRGNG